MKQLITCILIVCLSGCSTVTRVHQKKSLSKIVSEYSNKEPIGLKNIGTTSIKITPVESLTSGGYLMDADSTTMIDFGEFVSPGIIVHFNARNDQEVIIESFVVKSKEKPLFLFYPVITALDGEFNKITEVFPEYEFDFNDNVLENLFRLPGNTRNIIIHTMPKFTGMKFIESSFRMESTGGFDSTGLGIGVAIALGGPVGAIGGAIASSPTFKTYVRIENEFIFSIAGAISIK